MALIDEVIARKNNKTRTGISFDDLFTTRRDIPGNVQEETKAPVDTKPSVFDRIKSSTTGLASNSVFSLGFDDVKQAVKGLDPRGKFNFSVPTKLRESVPVDEINQVSQSVEGIVDGKAGGLTSFTFPQLPETERRLSSEVKEFASGALEKTFLPFTAPVTIATNVVSGLIKDIKGKDSSKNVDAIKRILAADPGHGDQIFVADLLKEVGVTDKSLKVPEGTVDKIGFFADLPLFGGVSKLQKILKSVIKAKIPTLQFKKELGKILVEANEKPLTVPRTAAEKAIRRHEKALIKESKKIIKKNRKEPIFKSAVEKSIKRAEKKGKINKKDVVVAPEQVGFKGVVKPELARQGTGVVEPEFARQGIPQTFEEFIVSKGLARRQGRPLSPKQAITKSTIGRNKNIAGKILQSKAGEYSPIELKFTADHVIKNSKDFGKALVGRAENVLKKLARVEKEREKIVSSVGEKVEGLGQRLFTPEQFSKAKKAVKKTGNKKPVTTKPKVTFEELSKTNIKKQTSKIDDVIVTKPVAKDKIDNIAKAIEKPVVEKVAKVEKVIEKPVNVAAKPIFDDIVKGTKAKPVVKKSRIKIINKSPRVIKEEAKLIREEVLQGIQGERIVRFGEPTVGVKSTFPGYYQDLSKGTSKKTILNALRRIEEGKPPQSKVSAKIHELIQERLESGKRFEPGTGHVSISRGNRIQDNLIFKTSPKEVSERTARKVAKTEESANELDLFKFFEEKASEHNIPTTKPAIVTPKPKPKSTVKRGEVTPVTAKMIVGGLAKRTTEEIPSILSGFSRKSLINIANEMGISPGASKTKDALVNKIHKVGFANPRGGALLRTAKRSPLTLKQLTKNPDEIKNVLDNPALYDTRTVANAKRLKSEGGFIHLPKKKKQAVLTELEEYKQAVAGMKGKWIKTRETFQDDFIRAKKLQDHIFKGGKIPESSNIEHIRRNFDGRVRARSEELFNKVTDIDKRIVKTSKIHGVSDKTLYDDIVNYLHAKHAPERNALKRSANAAGMTNETAKKIIAEVEASPFKNDIKKFADELLNINKNTLNVLFDGGLIDKNTFNILSKNYKNHVPLRRLLDESDDIIEVLSGKGFDVKGGGIKRAVGSERQVIDIVENIVANAEQAIIRAEKNRVNLGILDFARRDDIAGLFKIVKQPGLVTDPLILTLREKGIPVHIKINDKNLAIALKGVNTEQIPAIFKPIATITRMYASLHTRFNYEFAFSNVIRDVQEMIIDVAARKGMGGKAALRAANKTPKSAKAVIDFIRGIDSEGARLYKQMRLDGGTTGGLGLSTREQIVVNFEKIKKINRSNPRKAAEKIVRAFDNWNTIFEDSTRLSVYQTALERGLPRSHAAFLAKEASINFNKKGTAGPLINGLYMFSNASMQGSTKILRAFKNPKVLGSVVSAVFASVFSTDIYNKSIDPEYKSKLSKYDRSNLNVLLPTDDGSFSHVTIPVSWGLKPIKIMAEYMSDLADGNANPRQALQGIMTSMFESYNPLAGDEDIVNTLTPSVFKLPVEIARNRAWYGSKIRPDWDSYLPDSASFFSSLENSLTGRVAINTAEYLSRKNIIEVSPENIDYAYKQLVGGAGRSGTKIVNTISAIAKREPVSIKQAPVISRFIRNKKEEEVLNSLFYSEKERVNKSKAKQKLIDIRRVRPVYESVKTLVNQGKKEEARNILSNLSPEDFDVYKKIKASNKRKGFKIEQRKMFSVYRKIKDLVLSGNKEKAAKILSDMSNKDKKAYLALKRSLEQ